MTDPTMSPTMPAVPAPRRRPALGEILPRLLALFLVASAIGGFVIALGEPFYHWRVVAPGSVYRSGTLREQDLDTVIDRFGVKSVLNLRTVRERSEGPWYEEARRVTGAKGVDLVDVPLPEGQPPTPEQVVEILGLFDDPRRQPVLFHCEHGVVRSAAVEGLYRREYLGETPEEALDRVAVFGRDLEKKYPDIARFIREYEPRTERRTAP